MVNNDILEVQPPRMVAMIGNLVFFAEGELTRAQICKQLGRKKTSHMIRMIELAVDWQYIVRDVREPEKGQPYYIYTAR